MSSEEEFKSRYSRAIELSHLRKVFAYVEERWKA